MKPDEVIAAIKRRAEEISTERVYFSLKKMGCQVITKGAVNTVKLILASHALGFRRVPIHLMTALLDRDEHSTRVHLHILGDKGILELGYERSVETGSGGLASNYAISHAFLEAFKRKVAQNGEE